MKLNNIPYNSSLGHEKYSSKSKEEREQNAYKAQFTDENFINTPEYINNHRKELQIIIFQLKNFKQLL